MKGQIDSRWTVRLERNVMGEPQRVAAEVTACSEDEAIGKALRKHGLHEQWDVVGWWPERTHTRAACDQEWPSR